MVEIIVQNVIKAKSLPSKRLLATWVNSISLLRNKNRELLIRFVDDQESKSLNRKYRHKNKPTNILSFPYDSPPHINSVYLGDLVICLSLVKSEAKLEKKNLRFHLAHLVVHGTLHLLGYTHDDEKNAYLMEKLEIESLQRIGISNPYIY